MGQGALVTVLTRLMFPSMGSGRMGYGKFYEGGFEDKMTRREVR